MSGLATLTTAASIMPLPEAAKKSMQLRVPKMGLSRSSASASMAREFRPAMVDDQAGSRLPDALGYECRGLEDVDDIRPAWPPPRPCLQHETPYGTPLLAPRLHPIIQSYSGAKHGRFARNSQSGVSLPAQIPVAKDYAGPSRGRTSIDMRDASANVGEISGTAPLTRRDLAACPGAARTFMALDGEYNRPFPLPPQASLS